jgi:hypothetical protein
MKTKIYRYLDIIVFITATSISCLLYLLVGKLELPVTIFAGGITLSVSIRQNRIENDRMFKELFLMFNLKYDEKFNNRLIEIERKTDRMHNYILTEDEADLVIDYLNLCAEEYLWFWKGRIDRKVWNSWEEGMKYYLNIQSIREIVEKEKKQKNSYYGLFETLKL